MQGLQKHELLEIITSLLYTCKIMKFILESVFENVVVVAFHSEKHTNNAFLLIQSKIKKNQIFLKTLSKYTTKQSSKEFLHF